MKLTATLTAINSKRDTNGNCYWAFRWLDHETGESVVGTISGGESNISAIRRVWNTELDDWDRSIVWQTQEMGIRDFNRATKDWPYAGCSPEDLARFIRESLCAKCN